METAWIYWRFVCVCVCGGGGGGGGGDYRHRWIPLTED